MVLKFHGYFILGVYKVHLKLTLNDPYSHCISVYWCIGASIHHTFWFWDSFTLSSHFDPATSPMIRVSQFYFSSCFIQASIYAVLVCHYLHTHYSWWMFESVIAYCVSIVCANYLHTRLFIHTKGIWKSF